MLSPSTVKKFIDDAIDSCERHLVQSRQPLHIVYLLILGFVASIFAFAEIRWNLSDARITQAVPLSRYGIVVSLLCSLSFLTGLIYFLRPHWQRFANICFIIIFLFGVYFTNRSSFLLSSFIGVGLWLLYFVFSYKVFISRSKSVGRLIFLSTLVFLAILIFFESTSSAFGLIMVIGRYRWLLSFCCLYTEVKNQAPNLTRENIFFRVFNPTAFFFSLPVYTSQMQQSKANIPRGIVLGLVTILHLWAMVFVAPHLATYNGTDTILSGPLGPFIWIYLVSYVTISSSYLYFRLSGYSVPDPFEIALLATSPLEKWRTWDTYMYNWMFQFIFVPLYKFFRKPEVPVIGVFAVVTLFHIGYFGRHLLAFTHVERLQSTFGFYASQAFLVILAMKFPRLFLSKDNSACWRGVILTLITQIMITDWRTRF